MLDTYERFHIYEISKQNIQLNGNFAETYNPLYDLIITVCHYIEKKNTNQTNPSHHAHTDPLLSPTSPSHRKLSITTHTTKPVAILHLTKLTLKHRKTRKIVSKQYNLNTTINQIYYIQPEGIIEYYFILCVLIIYTKEQK
jgi:hypothetical protein